MKRNNMVVSGNIPCEACGGLTFAIITTDKGHATACVQCDEVRILQAALVNLDRPPSTDEKLNTIISMLSKLVEKGETELASIQDVLGEVAKQTTLVQSNTVLLQQLRANVNDPVAMQQILDGLLANDTALAQAQVANTPAAGTPVGPSVSSGPTSSGPGQAGPSSAGPAAGGSTTP